MAIRKFLNKYWGWTFLLIPLALQAIFFYFPMVQGAFYSLTNWTGLTYNYKFVGLNNYKLLMIDGKFFTAIAFTLILTLALIIGEITIGMVVARALNSKMKGQTFFRAWFFFPAVLSGLTVSLIFKLWSSNDWKNFRDWFFTRESIGDTCRSGSSNYFCSSMARSSNANYSLSCWSSEYSK